MVAYVTVGVDDLDAAERFYTAFLPALGYTYSREPGGLSFSPEQDGALPDVYVLRPFDGRSASSGNGTMTAFKAKDQAEVRELYELALASGGTDEGAPGFRAIYSANFYVCYLRDPQGNKIAMFSNNPEDPDRDGNVTGSV